MLTQYKLISALRESIIKLCMSSVSVGFVNLHNNPLLALAIPTKYVKITIL